MLPLHKFDVQKRIRKIGSFRDNPTCACDITTGQHDVCRPLKHLEGCAGPSTDIGASRRDKERDRQEPIGTLGFCWTNFSMAFEGCCGSLHQKMTSISLHDATGWFSLFLPDAWLARRLANNRIRGSQFCLSSPEAECGVRTKIDFVPPSGSCAR